MGSARSHFYEQDGYVTAAIALNPRSVEYVIRLWKGCMPGVKAVLMVVTFTIYSSGSPQINTVQQAVDIFVNTIKYYYFYVSCHHLFKIDLVQIKCDIDRYASASFR